MLRQVPVQPPAQGGQVAGAGPRGRLTGGQAPGPGVPSERPACEDEAAPPRPCSRRACRRHPPGRPRSGLRRLGGASAPAIRPRRRRLAPKAARPRAADKTRGGGAGKGAGPGAGSRRVRRLPSAGSVPRSRSSLLGPEGSAFSRLSLVWAPPPPRACACVSVPALSVYAVLSAAGHLILSLTQFFSRAPFWFLSLHGESLCPCPYLCVCLSLHRTRARPLLELGPQSQLEQDQLDPCSGLSRALLTWAPFICGSPALHSH